MPDIQMRFDKDMLVLSAPLRSVLARQGVDVDRDLEYMLLVEPEALRDTVRMEKIAGAQCLVAATEGIAPARGWRSAVPSWRLPPSACSVR